MPRQTGGPCSSEVQPLRPASSSCLTQPFQVVAQGTSGGYIAAPKHRSLRGRGREAALRLGARRLWATQCLLSPFLWASVAPFVQWELNSTEFRAEGQELHRATCQVTFTSAFPGKAPACTVLSRPPAPAPDFGYRKKVQQDSVSKTNNILA